MNKEQVTMAIQAGMVLLGPDSDVQIPAKLNDGVFLLKQLLGGIGSGQIALSNVEQQPQPPSEPPTPSEPPAPTRNQRRVAKKASKKKA